MEPGRLKGQINTFAPSAQILAELEETPDILLLLPPRFSALPPSMRTGLEVSKIIL